MKKDSYKSYWYEVYEFRKELKKIIIPYNKFFRADDNYIDNSQPVESVNSDIKN